MTDNCCLLSSSLIFLLSEGCPQGLERHDKHYTFEEVYSGIGKNRNMPLAGIPKPAALSAVHDCVSKALRLSNLTAVLMQPQSFSKGSSEKSTRVPGFRMVLQGHCSSHDRK